MTVLKNGVGYISPSIAFPSLICKKCKKEICYQCEILVSPIKATFEDGRCVDCKTGGCLQCKLFIKLEPSERCPKCGELTCNDCPLFPLMSKKDKKFALNRWKNKNGG